MILTYAKGMVTADDTKGLFNDANINIFLQDLICSGILRASEVSDKMNMLRKKQVDTIHTKKIYTRKDGRVFTRILENGKEKQVAGKDETELYEKLYDFYFGDNNASLEDLYPQWVEWRTNETNTSQKTVKENGYIWNAHLRDNPITQVPLKQLKPKDFICYFRTITKGVTLTRKRFNDLKSVMNGIIYFAIEKEIIEHNYLRDINYRQFTYKPENNDVIPYTEMERLQIINQLSNDDLYSLAIKLDFYLTLRISELKGLMWDDIRGDLIYIQRLINDKNEILDDIKGHKEEGKRYIPLTSATKVILNQIKLLNPNSEYLFIRNNKTLATVTFNRRIKKCCTELGIEYRPSHKVRFSTASILFKNGVGAPELQKMLGHTTLTMTSHYLRSVTPADETIEKMGAVLG
ncbi:hypothetical protein acsn021_43880 [Anaerocolumna cellulosilytica]|uniref:Uncharacterized protein n=1 Tax=Anaerocolumna cellulosilytica TaxID=433286 RepID=A0A6S6R650_9FIRM|nr:tyrosine-type recombinase/integrase [Anaerocolumna cellulosilytica]MBB5198129.1 integrase [Anaerocolumna cellulosilytica]BCJ96819.1 hypothetical protein acsn021_43880 [Anaerocolumna cellulosilytica]